MTERCPLCGSPWSQKSCQASCPLGKNCRLVCCPNCGYRTVAESSLIKLGQKLKERLKGYVDKTDG